MGGSVGRLRAALAEPENEEALRIAFQSYDKDKNGLLDHEELLRFAHDVRSLVKRSREPLEAEAVEMHSERAFVSQLLAAVEGEAKGACSFDAFVRFVRAHPRGAVPLISLAKNEVLCEWEGRPFVCGTLSNIFDYEWKEKLRDAAGATFGEEKIPPPE